MDDTNDVPQDARIVIIGAGCFGLSTAFHLLSRGYTDVTVLDRSSTLPAPDAASNDINRIVRSSYTDAFYTTLVREAIASWKDHEIWGDAYHESGVVILGLSNADTRDTDTYADDSYRNDFDLGCRVEILDNREAVRACFPPQIPTPTNDNLCIGYLNRDGGWVNAKKGLSLLLKRVQALNGKVLPDKNAVRLCPRDTDASKYGCHHPNIEIHCSDSTVLSADLVIVAAGSWTASAFPELALENVCLATGHCMTTVQLTPTEAETYRQCPVVLDFNSGFYVFPPNENNVVKLAIHSAGYTHFKGGHSVSTPRTVTSDPEDGLLIPRAALIDLREHLRNIYPELAEKPFASTRLCWYNDTPDGNWIIGRLPSNPSIILATGDSGHAYKFLPVIGHLVADAIENKLSKDVVDKFAVDRHVGQDRSRSGYPMELDLDQLCGIQDP